MYTYIEKYIKELYTSLSISSPKQLDIKVIAKKVGIKLSYGISTFRDGNDIMLQRSTRQREWQLFGHELCHFLRHCGHQLNMHQLFVDLQENQANYFAYHFCVPTFMLRNFEFSSYYDRAIHQIAHSFNVTTKFAKTRLDMYQNKQLQYLNHRQLSPKQFAETVSSYEANQVEDADILNEEFYDYFNLDTNAEEKKRETIEFYRYIKERQKL